MIATLGPLMLAAALTAFLVTLLSLRAGVLDFPNARSAHERPTPRGGGLGLVAGLGAGALAASISPIPAPDLAWLLALAGAFAALGFLDDLVTVPTKVKFALFVGLCLALAWAAEPVLRLGVTLEASFALPYGVGLIGSALFAFVVINAVNFMDGSDGILVAVMVPASLALSVAGLVAGVGEATLIGAGLAASLCGFFVLNRAPAKIFAGDVGSLFVGASYAAGALAMAGKGFSGSLWLAPLFVLVFLADVLLTLLRRLRHRRLSLQAHREHTYQRLILSGWSHGQVALAYGALTSVIALTGLIAAQGPDGAVALVFAVWVLALAALYVWIDRRLQI